MLKDAIFTLYGRFKNWRRHRRTFRALGRLDERQLRDIGLTRDGLPSEQSLMGWGKHKSYRALGDLDDSQLSSLSERGLELRREIRRRR